MVWVLISQVVLSVLMYVQVVAFEKARSVLFGAWGFAELQQKQQGVCGLFHGHQGCGKHTAAEAVAWEVSCRHLGWLL